MKDEYLINYKLFCQRKKFNLYNFLSLNKMSYEELKEYFRNKLVTPPSIDLYDKVILKVNEESRLKDKAKEIEPEKIRKAKKRNKRSKKNEQS